MVSDGAGFHRPGIVSQANLVGRAYVKAPTALQLPVLSFGVLGAQAVWSIDMAFAPPYLLDLGLSKSAMAAVFVAGPLSGLIVQPLIGALADKNTSKYGRRRPFIAVSVLICTAAIILLGFTRQFASIFTEAGGSAHGRLSIALAVIAVYVVDFSVNAITALDRALMIDVAAIEDQAAANAWAARLSGCGAVLSFLFGNLDLPSITPSLFGTTQIQIISLITCFLLLSTHAITLYSVQEQVMVSAGGPRSRQSIYRLFKDLYHQAKRLPPSIVEIFKIQFFAWIGWFPVLFYSTVWVGDIFRKSYVAVSDQGTGMPGKDERLFEEATRAGSHAMFWHALVALVTSVVLPLIVPNPLGETQHTAVPSFLQPLKRLRNRSPDLPFWWVFSHFIFFSAMMGTYIAGLAQSVFFASLLIASVGFCWAITNWVPFGLLGILIQDEATAETHLMSERSQDSASRPLTSADRDSSIDSDDEAGEEDVLSFATRSALDDREESRLAADGTHAHSGSVLGLHNLAVVIPQFIVTAISSVIFALMEPAKPTAPASSGNVPDEPPQDAVGIVFRIGGVSAFVAGVLAIRFVRRYGHLLTG